MKYEREFLQQKGIPHLPGDWDFRSEAQQVNWISENYPFERGFIVDSIYNKLSKKIRVDLKRRFYEADEINFVSFWIDREYFKRNYPSIYEKS